MAEDFDNEVGFWIENIPYLWVQGETVYSSKRFYLLKDYTLELFDESNILTDITNRKTVGMRTPDDRRLSTSKETFSLIPIEGSSTSTSPSRTSSKKRGSSISASSPESSSKKRGPGCSFVRDYFLVWTFSTRERDGKPLLYKNYTDKKKNKRARYNPWVHSLDIRIEGVRYKQLEPEHQRNFDSDTMIILEGKESTRVNKTRTIRLRGYEFSYSEKKDVEEEFSSENSEEEEDKSSSSERCIVAHSMEKQIQRYKYYQDRKREWAFDIPSRVSYTLLCRLSKFVERLFSLNLEIIERDYPEYNVKDFLKAGEDIYEQKPSLAKSGITWSQNDYDHPGFHRAYIRYKSIQRFTETWALLRRAHNLGILYSVYKDPQPRTIRVASLAGGPGFELYALREFFSRYYPHLKVECISLDLAGSWRPYAEELGLEFDDWNLDDGKGLTKKLNGKIDFAIISYALHMYLSKPMHIKWVSKAILNGTIPMLFVNSRMDNLTPHISGMKDEGVSETDLIVDDSKKGRDNRQIVYHKPDLRIQAPTEKFTTMFPNVPYEKKDSGKRGKKKYKR